MAQDKTPTPAGVIAVCDDDKISSRLLCHWLEKEGYQTHWVEHGRACLELLNEQLVDVILLDVHMPVLGGIETLERLKKRDETTPVLMLTHEQNVDTVVHAMSLGAWDYLTKPLDRLKLLSTLKRAVEANQTALNHRALQRLAAHDTSYCGIVSHAEAMERVFHQLDRLAASDITVLLHGESGTGKELVAQAIHAQSARSKRGAFVAVNCAAISRSLQESAFFGHEKGAFTGADRQHIGHFERADHGTLFLDEVAELHPELQAALLRVLQESRITRVGGSQEIDVEVRVIAASHKRLEEEVEAGRFRQDLFYRLAVFELDLPPLRERPEDISLLSRHFLDTFAAKTQRPSLEIAPNAMQALVSHDWPGNIRELRNALERALVLADDILELEHLPRAIQSLGDALPSQDTWIPGDQILPLQEVERRVILHAYEKLEHNVSQASRALGISRAKLYRKLHQYNVLRDEDA